MRENEREIVCERESENERERERERDWWSWYLDGAGGDPFDKVETTSTLVVRPGFPRPEREREREIGGERDSWRERYMELERYRAFGILSISIISLIDISINFFSILP